jgi:hypothetical protein
MASSQRRSCEPRPVEGPCRQHRARPRAARCANASRPRCRCPRSQRAATPLPSLSLPRRTHDHHRDPPARLDASSSANRSNHRHQDRHLLTTIALPRRRSDSFAQRWLRAGGDHARADAPSRHRGKRATATFNDNLNHQVELLPPASRVINLLKRLCTHALTPSAPAKSPLAECAALKTRKVSRGTNPTFSTCGEK